MQSLTCQEENVDFIARLLIPEMVHDRCFCDTNSREFVEFQSVVVEPIILSNKLSTSCEIYRVKAVIRFSGEPRSFPLVVKLLSKTNDSQAIFEAFQNEEMFYSKMTLEYGKDNIPKCYLSDLGRYGRPVIVLEDLEANGYTRLYDKLDDDHLELCIQFLGRFHGRGLQLRAEKFTTFREFSAKLLEINFSEESLQRYEKKYSKIMDLLQLQEDSRVVEKIKKKVSGRFVDKAKNLLSEVNEVSTLCHSHFSCDNLLFKYEKKKPIDIKVIDWQTIRYCSPAIDLAATLVSSALTDNQQSKLQKILTSYIAAMKLAFSKIDCERVKEDTFLKLPFALFISSFQENISDDKLVETLRQLERLGVFD